MVRRIVGERGCGLLIPILAFPPVLWTIGLGQNGFLTAGLFGAATLLVNRRPWWPACCSARSARAPFALLVPVALVAGGHRRAFAAAFASAAGLCLLSLAVFGWQTWHAFLTAAAGSGTIYESGRIPFGGFVTPFGAAMLLGADRTIAVIVQAAAALAAAGLVAWIWRRNLPLPVRAASLASATLVAVPLALFYDLVLAGVAAAWLLRGEGEYRLPEWGKLVLAGLYVLSLNPRGIAMAWHLPVGAFIALALAALVAMIALGGKSAVTSPGLGPRRSAPWGLLASDPTDRRGGPNPDIVGAGSSADRPGRALQRPAAADELLLAQLVAPARVVAGQLAIGDRGHDRRFAPDRPALDVGSRQLDPLARRISHGPATHRSPADPPDPKPRCKWWAAAASSSTRCMIPAQSYDRGAGAAPRSALHFPRRST